MLRAWHDLILADRDDLAVLLTLEQGKPLAEAQGEIVYAASFVDWFAEEARRPDGEMPASHLPNRPAKFQTAGQDCLAVNRAVCGP